VETSPGTAQAVGTSPAHRVVPHSRGIRTTLQESREQALVWRPGKHRPASDGNGCHSALVEQAQDVLSRVGTIMETLVDRRSGIAQAREEVDLRTGWRC
jgi:hypothetical protein